jgi:uncharacterized protein YgiM (DUF1202 family)
MLKKHTASKIFLFLVTATAIFISASGLLTSKGQNIIFQLLFLPVTLFLIYSSLTALRQSSLEVVLSEKKSGLLLYSVIFFVLVIVGVNNVAQLGQKGTLPTNQEDHPLLISSPTPTAPAEKTLTTKTESAGAKINVRVAPSISAAVITKVFGNEHLTFLGEEGDWYRIKIEDDFGYIHKDYAIVSDNEK